MAQTIKDSVKVADEVWLVTALLQREDPEREDFTIGEIVERAREERIHDRLRPGVRVHATLHNVANLPPNPGRYRMLFATGKSTRRLFRDGDAYDPNREGAKIVPERSEIPSQYHYLIDWYFSEFASRKAAPKKESSILVLRGLGRDLWRDEEADEYVQRLRKGWL